MKTLKECLKIVTYMTLLVAMTLQKAAASDFKAKTTLETIEGIVWDMVTPIAVISLILLGIAYANSFVEWRTLWKWGGGLFIVGAARQIVPLFVF